MLLLWLECARSEEVLINCRNEVPPPRMVAGLEERFFGRSVRDSISSGISGFRVLVSCLVRTGSSFLGSRTRKAIDGKVVRIRLDIRHLLLFWNLLVVDICPSHLRRFSPFTSLLSTFLRNARCRIFSRNVCGDIVRFAAPARHVRNSDGTFYLGFHGVFEVLAYREQLEFDCVLAGLQ